MTGYKGDFFEEGNTQTSYKSGPGGGLSIFTPGAAPPVVFKTGPMAMFEPPMPAPDQLSFVRQEMKFPWLWLFAVFGLGGLLAWFIGK